jgi:hypothetical protein
MADLNWFSLLRILLLLVVAALFVGSLLGLLIIGPLVVRAPRIELDHLKISSDRLRESVRRLCTEFTPRDYVHTENLDRAADWIAGELRESGLEVELQEYELADGRYRNVVARRPGSDLRAGAVVIGAHYDAFREYPGANDNASGVAVLLELARNLDPRPPRTDLYLVAFSTEEPPFFGSPDMGSARFLDWLDERDVHVELMVALDLVGSFSDEPGSQHFPAPGLGLLYTDRADFIAVVGDLGSGPAIKRVKQGMRATRALPVHSFRAPDSIPGVNWSDNLPFRERGLPAVLVTDTAFMRYPHYHTPDDTPDRLDYERMAGVVHGLAGVLHEPDVRP